MRVFGKTTFFVLFTAFALAACASWQEGWTEAYQKQFRETCLAGDGRLHPNPDAYCECALDKTMQRYPTIALFMALKDSVKYRNALQQCR